MYSDNGTNFVGLVNLFSKVNWKTVEDSASIKVIKWIFNPPISRLVGQMVGATHPNCQKFVEENARQCKTEL